MMKITKKILWLLLILIQSFAGIGAGLMAMSSVKAEAATIKLRIENNSFTVRSVSEAEGILSDFYREEIPKRKITVKLEGNTVGLALSDIDAAIDVQATLEDLKGIGPINGMDAFFFGLNREIVITPVFSYNSGKLLDFFESFFSSFQKEPEPDSYAIIDGNLVHTPQKPGLKPDYKALEARFREKLNNPDGKPFEVNINDTSLFVGTEAQNRYSESFNTVVSKAVIPLPDGLDEKVRKALEAMNGKVFKAGSEISLQSMVEFSDFSSDVEKEALNRIATALYQALLKIEGMKTISRRPAQRVVTYTSPGLEAVIEGAGADLVMKNNTERSIMILTEASSDSLGVYIVSTGALRSGELVTAEKDHVPPPVITSINSALLPNETRIVSEGQKGFTASVSRVIDGVAQELYTDKYQPVSRILETGQKPIDTDSK